MAAPFIQRVFPAGQRSPAAAPARIAQLDQMPRPARTSSRQTASPGLAAAII